MRKDELVRLYAAAGLPEDAELLTKNEIVDCVMAARDDVAELPPSSPSGVADSASSDYSSDGGNVAGGEETDFGLRVKNGLKRRATVNGITRAPRRWATDRSFSVNNIDQQCYPSSSSGKRARGPSEVVKPSAVDSMSKTR